MDAVLERVIADRPGAGERIAENPKGLRRFPSLLARLRASGHYLQAAWTLSPNGGSAALRLGT